MFTLIVRTLLLLATLALSPAAPAAGELPPQTSDQGGVTVKVTPRRLAGPAWEFELVFDTHVQALQDDVLRSAVLIAADGSPVAPVAWDGDAPGGHHRKGVLRFDPLEPSPAVLELRLARSGEPAPRAFKWTIRRGGEAPR